MTQISAPTDIGHKPKPRGWKRPADSQPKTTGIVPGKVMTVNEVAKLLACSKKQVENFIADGEILAFNIGRGKVRQSLRIADHVVAEFISKNMIKPSVRTTDTSGYAADFAAYLAKKGK